MGKVECCALEGYELLFYANDHLPAHVHVRRSWKWEIRVYLQETTEEHLEFSIKWPKDSKMPSGREKRTIRTLIARHKVALLAEWERRVDADR